MKTISRSILGIILLFTAVGCGVLNPTDRSSGGVGANQDNDKRFGEVTFLDAVDTRIGQADLTLYFFDVCPVGESFDCRELSYIINNKDMTEIVVANQPAYAGGSREPKFAGYTPTLSDLRARYEKQKKTWPQASRLFEIDPAKYQDNLLVSNYVALKRCRSHPRWQEFVDMATSKRSAVYLSITADDHLNGFDDSRAYAPGALRVDPETGEISWITKVKLEDPSYSRGQVAVFVNLRDDEGKLIKDNLFLEHDGFQFSCDLGFRLGADNEDQATRLGFNLSPYRKGEEWRQIMDPIYLDIHSLEDLPELFAGDPKRDPRCTETEITDYEKTFFPILNTTPEGSEK